MHCCVSSYYRVFMSTCICTIIILTVGIINVIMLVTQLRYADKRIINIMKVYIKGKNLELELI